MFVRFILALLLVSSCQLLADNQYNYENALKLYQQKQFDSAGIHLRNVLKDNPDNLAAQILLGKILLEQQHFAQALNVLEGALTDGADVNLLSDELSYIYLLFQDESRLMQLEKYGVFSPLKRFNWLLVSANLYQENGKYTEAATALDNAEQLFADNASLLNAKAGLAIRLRQFGKANNLLQQTLAKDPQNIETLLLLGNLAKQQQQPEAALDYYQRALALQSDNPFVLRALSAAWFAVGQPDKARPLLLKLQDMGLNDAYLRFSLLLLNAVLDNKTETTNFVALRDDLNALPADYFAAAPAQLYLRAALNYLLGASEQAIQDLEAYLKLQPQDSNAIALIAEHYLRTREPSMALRFLERHQEHIQNSVPLLAQHVLLTMRAGKLKTAETMLSDIRARFPADATLAALDADLKRQLYGPELALQELNKQQSPDTPATLLTGALLALDIGDNDAALEKAHQLITLAPDNADYLNLYAGILLQAQQYQSANQTLQQLLKLKPEHFAGRLTLANLYISQGKIQEAETLLSALLKEQPYHQATTVLLAATELQLNKTQQAEQRLNTMLNRKYYRPAVDLLLRHYLTTNALTDARYLLQRALRQEFLDKELLFQEVDVLLALNETAQAEDKIKLIQSLPELSSGHWLQLGKIQQRLGHPQLALQNLATALQLSPDQPVYQYEYIAMLIANNKLTLAKEQLTALKGESGQSADAYLLRAEYANQTGNSADAFAAFQTSISKDPLFNRAWAGLYELARQEKYNQPFVTVAEQYLSANPDNVWLRRLLAEHHINHHSYAAAKQQYQQLLNAGAFTDDPWLYNNLANALLTDDAEQALVYAIQADKLLGNNPRIQLTRAKALLELHQFDQALPVLRQAFALDSTNAEVNYLLAECLVQLQRKEEARLILQKLVKSTSQSNYQSKASSLLDTL
ncbi:tetratricopeptide repeat protein [Rheinheimera sp.]|uniref:tetratricopeptide repeat protein n=1 Tax=Rheinheimera sp. TaxID=1869214 RepID=UPI002356CCC3|nr:tetratricopeptide repeat protein [Rheinheimera sp.]